MRSIHTASVKHKPHAFIVYAGKAELQKAKSAAAAAAATTTKSQKAPAAAATTPDVASADVDPSCLTSWLVMQEPKKWLSVFVDHWVSDGVMPEPIDHPTKLIAQWAEMKTKGGGKKYKNAPHKLFPGCCRQWLNNAFDFAISQGYVPVIFELGSELANLCPKFIAATWCCYVGYMDGRPAVETDRAQQVYQYLLANEAKVVQCWRARIYYYSSGTIFNKVLSPMREWYKEDPKRRKRILLRLKNRDGLYAKLSDCYFAFMKEKTQPFPHATKSQMDFWHVPAWKRAMVHIFGLRHILDEHCTKQWKNSGMMTGRSSSLHSTNLRGRIKKSGHTA